MICHIVIIVIIILIPSSKVFINFFKCGFDCNSNNAKTLKIPDS